MFRFSSILAVLFFFNTAISNRGAGTLTNCTEATLRQALRGGGLVTLSCDGIITLTNSIIITKDATLQATGHLAGISGGNLTRLFIVNRGVSFTINSVGLVAGHSNSTNLTSVNISGSDGGAIYNDGGNLTIVDSTIGGNVAVGQTGADGLTTATDGQDGQSGTPGRGGFIFNNGGVVILTGSTISGNTALGGNGGNGAVGAVTGNGRAGGDGGAGGTGSGGAIYNGGSGTLIISYSTFSSNQVTGATGGSAGAGTGFLGLNGRAGYSGDATGAAIFNDSGQVTILNSTFALNAANGATATNQLPAVGGANGATGVNGGNALGGAICSVQGSLAVTNSTFFGNVLTGGTGGAGGTGSTVRLGSDGGKGGTGGAALGGSIYDNGSDRVSVVNCTISSNTAQGGAGGAGGAAGGSIANAGNTGDAGNMLGAAIYSGNGFVSIGNTILANSFGADNVGGSVKDLGGNVNSDTSFTIQRAGSVNNTDPILGDLVNNGGRTQTMAISSNSPAIDAANQSLCPPLDQRDFVRFGKCDIGAYEYGGILPPSATGLMASIPTDGSVSITWRADAFGYELESSTNLLSSTNWTRFVVAPTVTNGLNTVTVQTTNQYRFFRLMLPAK